MFFGLKVVKPEDTFGGSDENFDFKRFYECFETVEEERMLLEVEKMLERF